MTNMKSPLSPIMSDIMSPIVGVDSGADPILGMSPEMYINTVDSVITEVALAVSDVSDLSGNGNALTQVSGGSQPISSGYNGRTALRFNGGGDHMDFDAAMLDICSTDNTIILFCAPDGGGGNRRMVQGELVSNATRFLIRTNASNNIIFQNGGSGNVSLAFTPPTGIEEAFFVMRKTGSLLEAWYADGGGQTLSGSGNVGGAAVLNTLEIGRNTVSNNQFFFGQFMGIVAVQSALTDAQINAACGELDAEFGTTAWQDI